MESSAAHRYRDVMRRDPPAAEVLTPFERAHLEFVFGHVWSRPGISRRERRLVTLACVAAADTQTPIEDHVYAALKSGDLSIEEMLEVVLHFAVYCGWPKASNLERHVRLQWGRVQEERGEPTQALPQLDNEELGINDWDARMDRGRQEFADVNLVPAPPSDSPYQHAGILNFVFGHVWLRPNLGRRDRRFVTIACVGLDDAEMPILSHVGSALASGDLTKTEMDEVILHFSAYYGFPKGAVLQATADAAWAARG
ncbi:MAG: carboxymuconolactone decarboxylase family protein [Actinomycetota bacterium]|nr:carboxymuconolactone decarboxylase family protein [Actinomycetota bacterium]